MKIETINYLNIIILSAIILISCNREGVYIEIYDYLSKYMYMSENTYEINLDNIENIELTPKFLIKNQPLDDIDHAFYLSNPIGIITLWDSLYILDNKQKSIFVVAPDLEIKRKMYREGMGPGEFLNPLDIATNGEFIFIYDGGNIRIDIFNQDFEFIKSIDGIPQFFRRSLSSGDSLLYVADRNSNKSGSITQYKLYPEIEEKLQLMPRLLPLGQQPQVLNSVEFYSNSKGYLVAGYSPIPNLFIYDPDGELIHYIILSGKYTEELIKRNNDFSKINSSNIHNTGIGLYTFIQSIIIDDNLNIYLFNGRNNIHIFS
jgi:hypothetical protein